MKKNKLVFAVSALMLLSAAAPIYYWHQQNNSRFPSSVETYAHPEFAEDEQIKREPLSLDIEQKDQGAVTYAHPDLALESQITKKSLPLKDDKVQVACQKDDAKNLESEIKKLMEDKEHILAEIKQLKKDKEKKDAPIKIDASLSSQDNMMNMMMQMTSMMLSQQMQQQQLNMQIMQLMGSLKNSDNIINEYMDPYAFSYNQFAATAQPRFKGHDFSMASGGGIGIAYNPYSQYGSIPMMGQYYSSMAPMQIQQPSPYGSASLAQYTSSPYGQSMMGSFEGQGQVSMPMPHDGFNFQQGDTQAMNSQAGYIDSRFSKVMF